MRAGPASPILLDVLHVNNVMQHTTLSKHYIALKPRFLLMLQLNNRTRRLS